MNRLRSLLAVAVLVLLSPRPAQASIWGELEKLSGPGRFDGGDILSAPLFCAWHDGFRFLCHRKLPEDGKGDVTSRIVVKWSRFSNDNDKDRKKQFDDLPFNDPTNHPLVTIDSLAFLYKWRIPGVPQAEVGAGAGFWGVGGDASFRPFKRFIVPLNASVAPLEFFWKKNRWAGILRFDVELTWVPDGFNAAGDFARPNSTFNKAPDFVPRRTFVIDLAPLLMR